MTVAPVNGTLNTQSRVIIQKNKVNQLCVNKILVIYYFIFVWLVLYECNSI